jgi:hypothetical protein
LTNNSEEVCFVYDQESFVDDRLPSDGAAMWRCHVRRL